MPDSLCECNFLQIGSCRQALAAPLRAITSDSLERLGRGGLEGKACFTASSARRLGLPRGFAVRQEVETGFYELAQKIEITPRSSLRDTQLPEEHADVALPVEQPRWPHPAACSLLPAAGLTRQSIRACAGHCSVAGRVETPPQAGPISARTREVRYAARSPT